MPLRNSDEFILPEKLNSDVFNMFPFTMLSKRIILSLTLLCLEEGAEGFMN